MHNSYFVLKQVSARLAADLTGSVLTSCFSQQKDVLVAGFTRGRRTLFVQADLNPSFSCLSFPDTFHRARRNSVDLFPEAVGGAVTEVRQFENERSFLIQFDNAYSILYKMHGNMSNAVLLREGNPVQLFRSALRNDLGIDINALDRPIDFSRVAFMACTDPRSHYITLGAPVWKHLASKGWSALPREKQWELFDDVLKELNESKFFIAHAPSPSFSVLSGDGAQTPESDVLRALTAFYRFTVGIRTLDATRKSALAQLGRRMKAVLASLREATHRKHELSSADEQARWADLIMAHLHAIPKGAESVSLPDFDGRTQVTIPLKKELDPQRNAERYYRKSKNRKLERDRVEELITSRKQELDRLSEQRSQVQSAQSAEELGHALRLSPADKKKGSKPVPYLEHEYRGYRILVGRNAASNETLTTKVAAPNDEWLHARDCPGSHVVVRAVGGKVTPAPVIERAAELAAWYSKRKNETLCPVIVTKKKYVRKRKGSAPGEVVVEREKVILVTPKV